MKPLLQIEGRVEQIKEGGVGQGLAQPSAFAEPTRTEKKEHSGNSSRCRLEEFCTLQIYGTTVKKQCKLTGRAAIAHLIRVYS